MGEPVLDRLISTATVGLVVCGVVIPVLGVGRVAINGATAAQIVPAAIATAIILPVQVWLTLAAARSQSSTRHRWALAGLAVAVVALLPVVGTTWLGAVFPLSTLVLVIVPRPYSVVTFAALVVLPIPLTRWLGEPNWATYFSLSTFMFGTSVAVPIWLIAAARQLQAARSNLADDAVLRERLRIDRELIPVVGAALSAILRHSDSANRRLIDDREAATGHLRAMVETARRSLGEARRLVRGYQTVSLRSELATAQRLLGAAGVAARVVLPPGDVPGDVPDALAEDQRRALRSDISAVLRDDSVRSCVIAVTRGQDTVRVEVRGDRAGADAARADATVQ